MNESQEQQQPFLLQSGCVIEFSPEHFMTQVESHQVFSFNEICELLHSNISEEIDHQQENWIYTGLQCSVMTPGKYWQRGTLRIRLEFVPDEMEFENNNSDLNFNDTEIHTIIPDVSLLDDIRQSLLNESEP
jgi:hypothetical protein